MAAVTVENITKRYGDTVALDGVSFEVEPGELFGIIGPDGAGKTSLFRIIATLILADSGTATVLGFDVVKDYKELRKRIGYMPGRFSLYQDMTVEENLAFFASVFGTTIEANYHLVEGIYKFLEPFKKRRAGKLSGGMKQKLALCCALIHKPDILYLDEPTTGVDPVSRKEFWEMLKQLQQEGITIIVSTPYMDEANLYRHAAADPERLFRAPVGGADQPDAQPVERRAGLSGSGLRLCLRRDAPFRGRGGFRSGGAEALPARSGARRHCALSRRSDH